MQKQKSKHKIHSLSTGKSGTNGKGFDPEQLNDALFWVEALFKERMLCPFYPDMQTAKDIVDNGGISGGILTGEGVYILVEKKHLTKEALSTFEIRTKQDHVEWEKTKNGYKLDYKGVPIHVRVSTRKYRFFKNPDLAFYRGEAYRIPNPFGEFWKVRHLIK